MSDIENWLDDFFELNPEVKEEEIVKKKKESSITLGTILSALDLKDKEFYSNLPDEQKKEVNLWMLMRFMSSSNKDSEHHLLSVNDIVNNGFSVLNKHPNLQWKLLSVCGTGKVQRHEWVKPPKKFKKNRIGEELSQYFPLLKDSDIEMLLNINTKDDLIEFFKDNGYDDKKIKELFDSD